MCSSDLDEELASWKNLYDWFTSIGDPDGFEGRDHPTELQTIKHFSDATLTILSALNNPLLRINFTNVFPLTVSDINFDTKSSADEIITGDATFVFQSYEFI